MPATSPSLFPSPAPLTLDDEPSGRGRAQIDPPRVDPYFKQSCNESIAGLIYEKFAEKLAKNRDDLITKTGCREVRFTVYVKDGKAALKATPVKDEG